MEKLISVDLKALMGFFKKPDINEGVKKQLYLTFNMLHKPALLGILGAVLGLEGYGNSGEFPEYLKMLEKVPVGIEPLNSDEGHYSKILIQYNNTTGFASQETDGILVVAEQVLLKPSFRCYLLLNLNDELQNRLDTMLQKEEAEYLPYMGKNDFHAWWENYREYAYEQFPFDRDFKVRTLIKKGNQLIKGQQADADHGLMDLLSYPSDESLFIRFEELPVGFDTELKQYRKEVFAYTNYTFKKDFYLEGLYWLKEEAIAVQLF